MQVAKKRDPGDVWVKNPGGRVVSVKKDSDAAKSWPKVEAPKADKPPAK